MTNESFSSTCLRHPGVLSNLRCGRCNDLICPQCMVQSPVGARCPDCANIGQAPIFRATSVELARMIGLSLIAAAAFGFGYAVAVWVMWKVGIPFRIAVVVSSVIVGMSGAPLGDIVRRAGKYKLDKRLRAVAAATVLLAWLFAQFAIGWLGVGGLIFVNIVSYLGLGVGVYIAMNRVRP